MFLRSIFLMTFIFTMGLVQDSMAQKAKVSPGLKKFDNKFQVPGSKTYNKYINPEELAKTYRSGLGWGIGTYNPHNVPPKDIKVTKSDVAKMKAQLALVKKDPSNSNEYRKLLQMMPFGVGGFGGGLGHKTASEELVKSVGSYISQLDYNIEKSGKDHVVLKTMMGGGFGGGLGGPIGGGFHPEVFGGDTNKYVLCLASLQRVLRKNNLPSSSFMVTKNEVIVRDTKGQAHIYSKSGQNTVSGIKCGYKGNKKIEDGVALAIKNTFAMLKKVKNVRSGRHSFSACEATGSQKIVQAFDDYSGAKLGPRPTVGHPGVPKKAGPSPGFR